MRLSRYHAALLVAISTLPLGCQEKESAPVPASGTTTVTATSPAAPETPSMSGNTAMGGAPMMAGGDAKPMTLAGATEAAPKQDKSLASVDKAYRSAEEKLKKTPQDQAAKKSYVEAAYNFGHAAEYSETLGPKVKYRAALYLYRKALEVDPKHQQSLKEKEQIEQIYQGMPGGIPQ